MGTLLQTIQAKQSRAAELSASLARSLALQAWIPDVFSGAGEAKTVVYCVGYGAPMMRVTRADGCTVECSLLDVPAELLPARLIRCKARDLGAHGDWRKARDLLT